mmetsp:Transcript_21659/g.34662  ORF Transcript_21659/g.34662 Transcript_21659/m.34662 type:complete len:106 (+) Transcript_21659:99-416(+)
MLEHLLGPSVTRASSTTTTNNCKNNNDNNHNNDDDDDDAADDERMRYTRSWPKRVPHSEALAKWKKYCSHLDGPTQGQQYFFQMMNHRWTRPSATADQRQPWMPF